MAQVPFKPTAPRTSPVQLASDLGFPWLRGAPHSGQAGPFWPRSCGLGNGFMFGSNENGEAVKASKGKTVDDTVLLWP